MLFNKNKIFHQSLLSHEKGKMFLWSVLVSLFCASLCSAQSAHTHVKLLSEKEMIEPGEAFDVGVLLKMDAGWHTYAKDPGDSGLPTSIAWELPKGFTHGSIRWPPPKKIVVSGLTNHVYEGETLLLVNIQSPKQGLKEGQAIEIGARVQWLECKESCIPGSENVQLSLKTGKTKAAQTETVELFKKYQAIAAENPMGSEDQPSVHVPQSAIERMDSLTGTEASPLDMAGFWKAIFGGLLGGMILNLMPCVLPVIGIKILSFVKQSKESPLRARQLGIVFGLGVVGSFWILAGAVILLQKAGHQIGWGFLFQEPKFLMVMALVVTLMGLNFFGWFEFELSSSALTSAHRLASQEGWMGAFMNGILATVLATPCTAPFLAPAVGFAFAQSPLVIFSVFTAIGVGLALPYVLLAWVPALLVWIPKPGTWMIRFKQVMGIPMLATALWLVWNLSQHSVSAAKYFLGYLVLISVLIGILSALNRARLSTILIAVLVLGGFAYGRISSKLAVAAPASEQNIEKGLIDWKPYSTAAFQEALKTKQPIFIDFTAAWCTTCQVNKATSIEIESVSKKIKELGVIAFWADWTKPNPEITAALKTFNRSGVPLYVVYPDDRTKPPIILPEVLTPQIVLDAMDQAVKKDSAK